MFPAYNQYREDVGACGLSSLAKILERLIYLHSSPVLNMSKRKKISLF